MKNQIRITRGMKENIKSLVEEAARQFDRKADRDGWPKAHVDETVYGVPVRIDISVERAFGEPQMHVAVGGERYSIEAPRHAEDAVLDLMDAIPVACTPQELVDEALLAAYKGDYKFPVAVEAPNGDAVVLLRRRALYSFADGAVVDSGTLGHDCDNMHACTDLVTCMHTALSRHLVHARDWTPAQLGDGLREALREIGDDVRIRGVESAGRACNGVDVMAYNGQGEWSISATTASGRWEARDENFAYAAMLLRQGFLDKSKRLVTMRAGQVA